MHKLLLLILLISCSTPAVKPKPLELDKFCNSEKMQLPANLSASGWVRVSDVRILESANQTCGRHAIEVATYNEKIANHNKPDGFFKKSLVFLQGLLAGAVIGFGIGAGN